MITIRLARLGKKGLAFYRIVAIDKKKKLRGQALATLGSWYPSRKELKIDKVTLSLWTKSGAKISSGLNKVMSNK